MPELSRGLRADKKRRTREEILANAVALFRKQGIRGTRSAAIATQSAVSPATLFNYFPTKSDLAEAWVRGEIHEVLGGMAEGLGEHGLRSGLRAACRQLAAASCVESDLRLEAWRVAGRAADPGFWRIEALGRVVEAEQGRGRIRADLGAAVLTQMLIEAIEGGLIAGLAISDQVPSVAGQLLGRVDLVLDGARKRNERVRAGSPARSRS
jgi:AcrR family transcriptional regulator